MSDDRAVYEVIAAALADVHEPDLSVLDPDSVAPALGRVLATPEARAGLLAWLNARVQELSGGRVSIEERPGPEAAAQDGTAPELPVRVVVADEPFAEAAVLRADARGLHYPMRG
ncbi:MAG: hypothetical protein LCH96_16755 [Actinobacteria bacterium]|nr:hypothetical protein [Actinomycetota bacterium]